MRLCSMAVGGERFAKLLKVKGHYITNTRSIHDEICKGGLPSDYINKMKQWFYVCKYSLYKALPT
jgi:hypothetical protein